MEKLISICVLCLSFLNAFPQDIEIVRKSKYVSTKDYIALFTEKKADKNSEKEPWLEKSETLTLSGKGLTFKIKGLTIQGYGLRYFDIPNPVFYSTKKEDIENNVIDFKITVDFDLITSDVNAQIGVMCRFLNSELPITSTNNRNPNSHKTLIFMVDKKGNYDIGYSLTNGNLRETKSMLKFPRTPFGEEPKQISINRYGPFVIFCINGKEVAREEIYNSNYIMAADLISDHNKNGIKVEVQKFTYEIFDMDYEGCISGNCKNDRSIKHVKNKIETAFVIGNFNSDGHCLEGTYYLPNGGNYYGKLINDAPAKAPYTN